MKKFTVGLALLLVACGAQTTTEDTHPGGEKASETAAQSIETGKDDQEAKPAPTEPAQFATDYDDTWHVAEGWPGEWPRSFAVIEDNVAITARSELRLNATENVECPLSQHANYHPWNNVRIEQDKLEFVAAEQIETITVDADTSLEAETLEAPYDTINLDLKAGESFEIIQYGSEGFAEIRFKGKTYGAFPYDLAVPHTLTPENAQKHLWVRVLCQNGERAWLRHAEMVGVKGFTEGKPLGFGEATDLDHADYQSE